jgi:outer membrane receptor protein involved in Fe transport
VTDLGRATLITPRLLRTGLAVLLTALVGVAPALAQVRVAGRVIDASGLALPGATVRVVGTDAADGAVITGDDGAFELDVPAGAHRLEVRLDGFETREVSVPATASATMPDVVLRIASFTEQTTVVGVTPTDVQPREFGAPVALTTTVIEIAPMRTNRYDDVLPLVPNVVRGPDGLISVAGARAPQGLVLLNGLAASDIASGDPVANIPIGAVENVQVVTTGFAAEYGPSTGGVTRVNSRAGGDTLRFTVNSFTPRPRLTDGGVRGIEAWTPNVSVRGPLAKGRAWFAQSFDYDYERTRADTVEGAQDRGHYGVTSFTQVDVQASRGHAVTGWVTVQRDRVEGEHLSAFTPRGTVPESRRTAWSGALVDRAVIGTATLESRIQFRTQETGLWPDGTGAYTVAHDLTRGAYFGTVQRDASAVEVHVVHTRAAGGHLFKVGGAMSHRTLDGTEVNTPVTYLRSSGVPAVRVEFVGAGTFDASSSQASAFAQDTWRIDERLSLDLGLRLDHDTVAGTLVAPRVGLTWKASERTTATAGAGWFAGDTPLATLAFDDYQARRITSFDSGGTPLGATLTYAQVRSPDLSRARAFIGSARIDYQVGRGWQVRLAVQERRGRHDAIVNPVMIDGVPVALLSSTGESRARSFEATLGYHAVERKHQAYVSYVGASTRGNTNDVGLVDGLFRDPRLVAPDMAPLPSDVPHRLLAWGLIALPFETTVAPFIDVRSGFPFSPIGDDWAYVGRRHGARYPAFASLDLVVNKMVSLPRGLRARVGVKLYNVAGRRNGRDVQADITRPDFGQTYNALGRQVRGVFEIVWGAPRR